MKREYLKQLGLEQDVIDKIMAENGSDIEELKQQLKTAEADKETLSKQIAEANKQIEEFKGMDIEGIKKAAEDYKSKFEKAEADGKAKIEKLQFDYALSTALSGAKARDSKAVAALLDMDNLQYDGKEITGLKDQIDRLKTEKSYLFEGDKTPRVVASTETNQGTDDAAVRAIMGLPKEKG